MEKRKSYELVKRGERKVKKYIIIGIFLFVTGIVTYNGGVFGFNKEIAVSYYEKTKVLFMDGVYWFDAQQKKYNR